MGWYALYKWYSPWSKLNLPNMIYWYKEYYLKTPEQRQIEKEERSRKAKNALITLSTISTLINNTLNHTYDNSREWYNK